MAERTELYLISMAAELLDMHPQTLRKYERLGLVRPQRTLGSMRVYAREEIDRLRLIKSLVDDGGINLAGVRRLLKIAEVAGRIRPLAGDMASGATGDLHRRLVQEIDEIFRLLEPRLIALRSPRRIIMEFKDYYHTLGVPKTASAPEIKRAVRKLAREFHPDLNAGNKTAEARFKEINEANEVLSDADSRKKYDELGANWRAYEQSERAGQNGAASSGPFGGTAGGGTYRTMTPEEMQGMFGDDDPFSDFFHRFFGGAAPGPTAGSRRGRAAQPRRGADFESPVELTLEEAFAGTTRRLHLDGAGPKAKTVEVRIPAGVADGARVRVAGEGEAGSKGGSSGDLFLRVHIPPHPRFVREGADLRVHVAVPITTAVLGGEIPVTTLSRIDPAR